MCRGIVSNVMRLPTLPLLALCALYIGTATSAFALLKDPVSLFPKAGQTALLYDNGRVILKQDYTFASSIYTRYNYFIGTKEQVAGFIKDLDLIDLPAPKVTTVTPVVQQAPQLLDYPVTLSPKAGQTVILYENGKVIFKRDYTAPSSIFTRNYSFIGTKEEVAAKIIELGLKDLPAPVITPVAPVVQTPHQLLDYPVSLSPKAGQTVILYENGKVIFKRDYTAPSSIYTRNYSFIGTKEQVAAKIIELGLKDLPVVPTIGTGTK